MPETIELHGESFSLSLFDSKKDVFLWVPEIRQHCKDTPFIIVGIQTDLREDADTVENLDKNKRKPITLQVGENLTKDLKAVKYVECSTKKQTVFELHENVLVEPILAALKSPPNIN